MTNCRYVFRSVKSYFDVHNYEHYMTIAIYFGQYILWKVTQASDILDDW